MDKKPDRSDLELGLQRALNSHLKGAVTWAAFNFNNIADENGYESRKLQECLPLTFPIQLLQYFGQKCRIKNPSVALIVREIPMQLTPIRKAWKLPPIEKDWDRIDGVIRPKRHFVNSVVTQSNDTCALDVFLFISVAFSITQLKRDAEPLQSLWHKTPIQYIFRQVINTITLPDITQDQRDKLRDLMWDVLQKVYPSQMNAGCSDICNLANWCWTGVRSLSYTRVEAYTYRERVIQPDSSKERRKTTHDIQLNTTSGSNTASSCKTTERAQSLGDIIAERYFYNQPYCHQLALKTVRILDDFPIYLCVPISKGCSIEEAKALEWDKDIELSAIVDGHNGRTHVSYTLVAVAFYAESHFARAIRSPTLYNLPIRVIEYDSAKGAAPYVISGGVLDNIRDPCKTRITLLLFQRIIS